MISSVVAVAITASGRRSLSRSPVAITAPAGHPWVRLLAANAAARFFAKNTGGASARAMNTPGRPSLFQSSVITCVAPGNAFGSPESLQLPSK